MFLQWLPLAWFNACIALRRHALIDPSIYVAKHWKAWNESTTHNIMNCESRIRHLFSPTKTWDMYCIVGNFCRMKLSWIGGKDFRGTFVDCSVVPPKDATPPNFKEKALQIATKSQNSQTFSPLKVFLYTVYNFALDTQIHKESILCKY